MTTQKKIELIEKLLKRYKWASWFAFLKPILYLDQGLCRAFKQMTGGNNLWEVREVEKAFRMEYPVTSQVKEDQSYIVVDGPRPLYRYFWFASGDLKPRINILKRTLKILKDKQDD